VFHEHALLTGQPMDTAYEVRRVIDPETIATAD